MKKIYTTAIALLGLCASLTGCSEDGFPGSDTHRRDPDVINMSVLLENQSTVAQTRAAETTLSTLESEGNKFMVWGYFAPDAASATPGNLYVGDPHTVGTVIGYSGGAWDYEDVTKKALWPSVTDPLNFQAVTPYDYGTVTNTPAGNIPCVAMQVTVPSDQSLQKDLLFGHEEEVTQASHDNSVVMAFEHAMAQIGFQAKKTLASLSVEVGGITVHNVRNSATVGYTGALTGSRRALAVSDYAATVGDFAIGMASPSVSVTSATPVTLNGTDGMLMMIPQSGSGSPDAWNTSASTAVPLITADTEGSEMSYLQVSCKVHSGSTYVIGTPSAFGNIFIPFKASWNVGCKYIYTLSFGSGAGGFDADGNPVLSLISYSVESMDDWREAEMSSLPLGSETVTDSGEIL